jgi:hypothetical protein
MKSLSILFFVSTLLLNCLNMPVFSQIFGRQSISLLVKNENGQPVSNIQVSFSDDSQKICIEGKTNHEGRVTLNYNHAPKFVYFHDTRQSPSYGIKVLHINYTSSLYEVTIPQYPQNTHQAADQIDMIFDVISKAEGANSLYEFIKSGSFNKAVPGIGVPGVFSISPIPTTDNRGRTVLRIDGVLVRHLDRLARGLLPGNAALYDIGESY